MINEFHESSQRWSTSSCGEWPDTSPREVAELGEHLRRCNARREGLSTLKAVGLIAHRFLAPRLVTSVVLFSLAGVLVAALA